MTGELRGDPFRLFLGWYERAAEDDRHPELVALATATAAGEPSVRMVQLQRFGAGGYVFYTGAKSRKGRDLRENPRAALCFYWHGAGRQVRIEGQVEAAELDAAEAAAATLAAAVTPRQGEPVADRSDLEARVAPLRERHGEAGPPLPSDWAAFALVPDAYEFWEYRHDNLHDRFRFSRAGGAWQAARLFP